MIWALIQIKNRKLEGIGSKEINNILSLINSSNHFNYTEDMSLASEL